MKKRTRIIIAIAIAAITFGTLHATVGKGNAHCGNRQDHSCQSNAKESESAQNSILE